jgi:hypothetical protein
MDTIGTIYYTYAIPRPKLATLRLDLDMRCCANEKKGESVYGKNGKAPRHGQS